MIVDAAIVSANWRKNWPDDPRDERAGHEHRRQHQADRDDRPGHLVHGPDRGVARGHAVLDVVLDRLDDDDRVVDHDADGQHQAEQREVIEAEAHRGHDREGADDRHRDGDQRDDRRPPVLEEQQHDDRHQDDRVAQGLEDLADRLADERRGVVADLVVEPVGEALRRARRSWP